MTAHRSIAAVLDAAERAGKLNVRTTDLAVALPGTSPEALRQALYRQQRRGRIVRLSRGSGHWLIVPLQHAASGAPPLETWLAPYLSKSLRTPYYVGLLSAAETYGASPYAVMVTQVMVPKPRRLLTVGRHQIVFHTRADIERMPLRWHETADGKFKVSTPELTALELVQREGQAGGMARVQEVLDRLGDSCSVAGIREALDAVQEVSVAQRLGTLLAHAGKAKLARSIERWLQGHKLRAIPLVRNSVTREQGNLDATFKVWLPPAIERANA